MMKYKTVVTDYEGMETCLDGHAAQGWRLVSLTPDTWRKSLPSAEGEEASPPFAGLGANGKATVEYSASYYLLVFQRDDYSEVLELAKSAEEDLPAGESPYEE